MIYSKFIFNNFHNNKPANANFMGKQQQQQQQILFENKSNK